MRRKVVIGLVGDCDPSVPAHQAIPLALGQAGEALGLEVRFEWIPTDEIRSVSRLSGFDGLWCVPASPYRSMDGALLAIRHAREGAVPFLGTCGGFQHAVVEYARNVLGWADAATETREGYRCRYGLNPEFQAALVAGPLRAAADDATGEVRAVELDGHPFFIATLFQPERAALDGRIAPLAVAFARACAG